MAEYNISAQITADTKGFESGVKKVQTASKKLGKSITDVVKGFGKSGLSGAITSAGLALGGIGLAVGTAVKAIKGITKALGECAEAYKVQLQAERALDTAINNSPYVSGSASKALKDFASEMQKVSNLGDEEIIPQMTQLIATGRTEAEVMKIIATASDMSASGAMSFDQAVTQLNATLNGNIGRLGQQNAELKALTKEELESGKAVDILGEKYKGLAQATVDTKKQLQNAIGDLKETFGSVFENAMAPMRKFFTEMIQGWADARKAKQEYEGAMIAIEKGEATANDYRIKEKKLLEEIEAIEGDLRKQAEELGMTYEEAYSSMADWQRAQLEAMKDELDTTQKLARMHEGLEKIKKLEGQWAEEEAKKKQEEIEKETRIADLKDEYLKKIAEQEARWQHIKEVTGEQIGNEEKIKFYQDSLVDLMTQAGGQITTNNQLYKDQMEIINKLAEGLEKQKNALADIASWEMKLRQQSIDALSSEVKDTTDYEAKKRNLKEILSLNLQNLQAQQEADLKSVEDTENVEEAKAKITEYYNNEKLALQKDYNEQVADIQREEEEEAWRIQKEQYQKMARVVLSYAQKIESAFKNVASKIAGAFKGIVGSVKGIFSKIFDGGIDSALDNLLVFEDKILTFFVETLPKLPQFVASALQSIGVLIQNIMSSGGFENLWTIFENIFDMVWEGIEWLIKQITANIPKVIKMISSVIKKIAQKIPTLVSLLIPAITTLISEVIKAIPQLLNTVLPVLLQSVLELVKALMQNLPQIISAIVEFLPDLILGVTTAIADFIANLKAEDFVAIVSGVIKAVATLGVSLVKAIPEILKGLWELAKGLIKGMWNLILEALKATWKGLKWVLDLVVDWFKDTFGGYATGTNNAQKGLALVGEKGPELVDFKGGERVYNATNTQRMLAGATGGNAGNTFNVTFNNLQDTSAYAMMSQLRAYNRQMAINGVI